MIRRGRSGGGRLLLFLVYLIFGLYFLNVGLNFIKIPTAFSSVDKWITLAGGVLLLFSAIRQLVMPSYRRYGYM